MNHSRLIKLPRPTMTGEKLAAAAARNIAKEASPDAPPALLVGDGPAPKM
jgi:hypothetical protein